MEVNRTASVSRIFFKCLIFDVSSLTVTISAFVKKWKDKDEASKKIRETNGGQIKEQDVPFT